VKPSPADEALARALVRIAQTLDSVDGARERTARVLALMADVVPYEQAALVRLRDDAEPELVFCPEPAASARGELEKRLGDLARVLGAAEDAPAVQGEARGRSEPERAHLAVPLVGLDHLAGILYVERPAGEGYDAHVSRLSIVAAQLGAYLTTVRLVEEQLEAARELSEAHRFQQQLVAIVSHDLRNPLAVITMSTQHLLRSCDAKAIDKLERVLANARRADGIIRDLLDGTQARLGGGIPIVRESMDLERVLREAVADARAAHPDRVVRFDSAGPLSGAGDAGRLAQVASNLLGNALRYSPPDGEVRVELRPGPDGAEIVVQNGGPPIPADLLPHIFDPFRRGPVRTRTAEAGLGLGLHIVREIVRGHEGRIEARSAADSGTTFSVSLPGFPAR
jgi:signal transduction histidine kinase